MKHSRHSADNLSLWSFLAASNATLRYSLHSSSLNLGHSEYKILHVFLWATLKRLLTLTGSVVWVYHCQCQWQCYLAGADNSLILGNGLGRMWLNSGWCGVSQTAFAKLFGLDNNDSSPLWNLVTEGCESLCWWVSTSRPGSGDVVHPGKSYLWQ